MNIITPAIRLAADEMCLLEQYRAMQDSPAGDLLALAQEYARIFPKNRTSLRLVRCVQSVESAPQSGGGMQ